MSSSCFYPSVIKYLYNFKCFIQLKYFLSYAYEFIPTLYLNSCWKSTNISLWSQHGIPKLKMAFQEWGAWSIFVSFFIQQKSGAESRKSNLCGNIPTLGVLHASPCLPSPCPGEGRIVLSALEGDWVILSSRPMRTGTMTEKIEPFKFYLNVLFNE